MGSEYIATESNYIALENSVEDSEDNQEHSEPDSEEATEEYVVDVDDDFEEDIAVEEIDCGQVTLLILSEEAETDKASISSLDYELADEEPLK